VIVYLARHGETTWNLGGIYQGRRESSLTALGMRQGMALALAMDASDPRPERVVSSPLWRTQATARFACERLDIHLELDEDLIEIGHGTWEGRQRDEIARSEPALWDAWKQAPSTAVFSDGDSLAHVARRWARFSAKIPVAPTLVVTHDAVARVALLLAQERSLDELWNVRFENAAYAIFDVSEDGVWRVREALVTEHLAGMHTHAADQAL
jgi:probable phosphoglycerate mutase